MSLKPLHAQTYIIQKETVVTKLKTANRVYLVRITWLISLFVFVRSTKLQKIGITLLLKKKYKEDVKATSGCFHVINNSKTTKQWEKYSTNILFQYFTEYILHVLYLQWYLWRYLEINLSDFPIQSNERDLRRKEHFFFCFFHYFSFERTHRWKSYRRISRFNPKRNKNGWTFIKLSLFIVLSIYPEIQTFLNYQSHLTLKPIRKVCALLLLKQAYFNLIYYFLLLTWSMTNRKLLFLVTFFTLFYFILFFFFPF